MLDNSDFNESNLENEYDLLCKNNEWNLLFQRIKNNASFKIRDNDCTISRSNVNRFKNKYRDIVPYDFNRITLPQSSSSDSDYINASLVQVKERSYIVTQYPSKTNDIFWLMVWHYKSLGIVMLGKSNESDSESYFPKADDDVYVCSGENSKIIFSIKLLEQFNWNGFCLRRLRVSQTETESFHELWHFEFWSWPDQGAPSCLYSFLTFMGKVRQYNILDCRENPAVIHCSAGAGRSGTFCLIDLALLQIEKQKNLDNIIISEMVIDLRLQRMGMVHSANQLKFSYLAVIEAFKRLQSYNFEVSDGFYLLCNEESNITNYDYSSSCSESAASDVIYYQLSDEEVISGEESSDLSNEYHLDRYCDGIIEESETELFSFKFNQSLEDSSFMDGNEMEPMVDNSNVNRNAVINHRKMKNQRNIDMLSRHLEDNSLKRFRLMTNVTDSSTVTLLDEINNNYYWSMFIVGGTIFFMGACLWLKYNPFK